VAITVSEERPQSFDDEEPGAGIALAPTASFSSRVLNLSTNNGQLAMGQANAVAPAGSVWYGSGAGRKLLSARQLEEAAFWGNQLREQCLLLALSLQPLSISVPSVGLPDPDADAPGVTPKPEDGWPQVQDGSLAAVAAVAPVILKLKRRARELVASWTEFLQRYSKGRFELGGLNNLVNHTRYLQGLVMELQRRGVWTGWLTIGAVQWMRGSLDYFAARFNDALPPAAERAFWDDSNARALSIAAHLVDPTPATRVSGLAIQALGAADDAGAAWAAVFPPGGSMESAGQVDLAALAETDRRFDHAAFAARAIQLLAAFWNDGAPLGGLLPTAAAHLLRQSLRSAARLELLASPSQPPLVLTPPPPMPMPMPPPPAAAAAAAAAVSVSASVSISDQPQSQNMQPPPTEIAASASLGGHTASLGGRTAGAAHLYRHRFPF
jgi:hypothetical protein